MEALDKFAIGRFENSTDSSVVDTARRIVQTAIDNTVDPDISYDDEEGDLEIDLRLPDGSLMLGNFYPDGSLDVSVYDDKKKDSDFTFRTLHITNELEFMDLFKKRIVN